MPAKEKHANRIQFVINDHMTAYLGWWARKGFPYAKKALEFTKGYSEVLFPTSRFFNSDWTTNEEVYHKQERKGLLKNLGTFHGLVQFHPLIKHYNIDYDDRGARDDNVKMIKAQILMAERMSPNWQGTRIIVVHPSPSRSKDFSEYSDTIMACFAPTLELADEKRTMFSFEPDLGEGKMYLHGSARHFDRVARLVERMTELAPKRKLKMPSSLTFDFSHTLLENNKDYSKMHSIVREFGQFIAYAHINHPIRSITGKIRRPRYDKPMKELSPPAQIWELFATTDDGHNPVQRALNKEDFLTTLRLLRDKTRIREYGRVNLEVGTRWDRAFNFWRSGASGYGTYKSLKLLDEVFNQNG